MPGASQESTASPVAEPVLRCHGEFWTVAGSQRVFCLRDSKGVRQLARLLENPGVQLHAVDLVDAAAARECRGHLEALRGDLDAGEALGDPERAARARELMALVAHDRLTRPGAERARLNATRALRTTIRRIAVHDPALGHHLQTAVRTGMLCVYDPGPPGAAVRRLRVAA